MPLFASPRARQLFASPDMQIKDEQPQPRRRLFGGPARGIFRREDGDPGTIANYALFGLNGVESMREGRQRRDLFGMQVRQQKEDAANLDQAIGSLDPSMQAWARLNPEAAAESQFRSPPARYGDLERIDGRLGQRNEITGQYDWAPQVSTPGSNRVQYRPVTPEEAQAYQLPGNGAGFVLGDNGRPIRVGGGGSFSADQRARVEIGLDPALEAVRQMDAIETNNSRDPNAARRSPRNDQWGASLVDMVDGEGTGSVARNWGGQEFQNYTSAGSAFESGMLPILSGAAVTDSEARRMIRAALPQLGDGPEVLAQKARRRRQMINGAAIIGGRTPPFPQDSVPDWAATAMRAYQNATAGEDGGIPDDITPEEWQAMTPEERALWQN